MQIKGKNAKFVSLSIGDNYQIAYWVNGEDYSDKLIIMKVFS